MKMCCMGHYIILYDFPLISFFRREGDTAARRSVFDLSCFPPEITAAVSTPSTIHDIYIIISLDCYYITACSTWFNKNKGFMTFFYKFSKNRHFHKFALLKSPFHFAFCLKKFSRSEIHSFTNFAECDIILLYNCIIPPCKNVIRIL